MNARIQSNQHLWISILLGFWVYLFLVFVAPFDIGPLSFHWRAKIMIIYGVLCSVSYLVTQFIVAKSYKSKDNVILQETVFISVFSFINFFPTYFYYKSDLVLGEYSFSEFLIQIYLASLVVIVPLIWLGKWAVSKIDIKKKDKIAYVGDNKMDVLHLSFDNLQFVQTAQNYVEFHYQEGGLTKKKLIRSTLKQVHLEIPALVQVHRSYLVNFDHFSSWESKNCILLHDHEIPVSAKYKEAILELSKSQP